MHTKQFYEAPEAELLVIKLEDRFLDGTLVTTPARQNYDDYYDLDD